MRSSANSHSRQQTSRSWFSSLAVVLLALAFSYFWILPLFSPRGDFLWGHYRLKDIYVGIPILVAALCAVIIVAAPPRYRRSLSLRLTTLAVSILLALSAFDVIYAFAVMGVLHANFWLDQAHISRRYSVADSELGFARKAGVSWRGYVPDVNRSVEYRTDENGFRNPPGIQRADLVFIGDSYTEAATVADEDTFVRRAGRSTGLSVVNLGRGAYGPQQELIVLKRYGLSYEPRVVVWQIFEGNDLADAEAFARWKNEPHGESVSLKDRYFNNSLLKEWLKNTKSQAGRAPMISLRSEDGTVRRIGIRYRDERDRVSTMQLGMNETINAIEAGYEVCRAQGIRLLVVSVPTMVRVMEPYIRFDREEDRKTYLSKSVPDQKDFNGRMADLCARIGCTFVDAFDELRQASAGNRNLYIPNDEHLDIGGHEVISRLVVRWLRENKIAKSRTREDSGNLSTG